MLLREGEVRLREGQLLQNYQQFDRGDSSCQIFVLSVNQNRHERGESVSVEKSEIHEI